MTINHHAVSLVDPTSEYDTERIEIEDIVFILKLLKTCLFPIQPFSSP